MGLLAKLKFKLRKRLAQGTVEPVAYGILGLVSLERVCKQAPSGIDRGRNQSFFAMNAPQGNPFAAAGALHMPFPLSAPPAAFFTGQQFGPPVMTPNSLERACKVCCSSLCSVNSVLTMGRRSLTPEDTRRVIKIATMQAAEYASKRATATMHLLLHLTDQACLPRALVALESQLVRLCKICTVCLGMNGIHIIAYSVELAHSFELRHQRNQDFDGLRTLDTPQILTLSLSPSLKCLGGLA
ncbi:hypothetical protein BFJ63_vAg9543 [Fusarium oxysporum f. sp. narcissi]|uniref:Uncharacterized protein n=2 Tax=Fusarium oxysporum TaxID=5507 RepID=A0A4Q2VMN5_FUSOX|nr:hypothetical protein BFJ65_g11248 [Fusarium oxysporum f. sp. cepae]RKK56351.1 hypothetical protein BFJ66_g3623 [Fusarium oxysporum f. sp. cepae]RYC87663.1 hypothetical protein BFJ63_vAg9543 [Fusarium oxysporum f. sp. narcissi]